MGNSGLLCLQRSRGVLGNRHILHRRLDTFGILMGVDCILMQQHGALHRFVVLERV